MTQKGRVFSAVALMSAILVWWSWPANTSTDRFMPHGHCYLWMPSLVRLHVGSDALIGISYVAISVTLVYVVRKRQDLPFNWMFLAFGMFIIACGATHFMEILTLWTPEYWLSGGVKLLTAGASVLTALLLPPLVPKILALPSPSLLAAANKGLEDEIAQRKRVEQSLNEQASALQEQAQLLDLAHDTIVVRALDGAIRFWNRAAEEMYGWSREESNGKISGELLHTEGPKPMAEIVAELVRAGRWEGELVQKRRDGGRIVVASRWALQRGEDGEPSAILEINRDVTERAQLEEQRRELARKQASMHEEIIQRQTEQLAEMATPLIPITDHVVVMPLVGSMDAARARQVMETALDGTARQRARVVILDVTGLKQVDTSVAATLIATAGALRLLGTQAVLTGVRPDVAQLLVSLDVDMTGIVTCGTLQNGIAYALGQTESTATFAAPRQDPGRARSRR